MAVPDRTTVAAPAGTRRVRFGLALAILAVGVAAVSWFNRGPGANAIREEVFEAMKAGDSAKLVESLDKLKRVQPLTGEQVMLAVQAHRDLARPDLALAALADLPDGDPLAGLRHRARGLIEFDRSRLRAAEIEMKAALTLDATDQSARRGLIRIYAAQNRRRELAPQFEALASDPKSKLSFDDLNCWALGEYPELPVGYAATLLAEAIRADPADEASRLALVEALRRLGRLDEAEAALKDLPAGRNDAMTARARIAIDRGDPEAAETLLRTAPAHDPGPSFILWARLLLTSGRAAEAVQVSRAALECEPGDRDAMFGLGQALKLTGKADEARPFLAAAEARDRYEWAIKNARTPTGRLDPKALIRVAEAGEAAGRKSEARAWYQLALTRDPLDAKIQSALFRLRPDGN